MFEAVIEPFLHADDGEICMSAKLARDIHGCFLTCVLALYVLVRHFRRRGLEYHKGCP